MYYKCCVDNCDSKRKDVKLHQFPGSEIGLKKWLKCINSDRLSQLSNREIRRMFVCHKHFEMKYITEKSRIRLGAYPTLFSEEEIRSGVPTVPSAVQKANLTVSSARVMLDHSYARRQKHEDHTYAKRGTFSDSAGPAQNRQPLLQEMQNLPQVPIISDPQEEPRPCLREIQNLTPLPIVSGKTMEQRPVLKRKLNVPQPVELPTTSAVTGEPGVKSRRKATRKRRIRKRLIRKVADLPPVCREIYDEYRRSLKQLDFAKRAKRAMTFSKSEMFEKLTRNLNPLARKIIWMQISQSEKKLKGRRFTDEEKMISLSIMKQSPKAYRFLQKIFILPSRNTLTKMISSLNVQPGINNQVFEAIKIQVETWDEKKKYCSIIFDEMSLEPGLEYDDTKDSINGFVHLNTKKNQYADHALAFMLRGAVHKWQQPIAYFFCEGATKADELKVILTSVINAVIDTGLLPVAVISDQGQSFQSALKGLSRDTQTERDESHQSDEVITMNGHNLNIIFDPPHLIKGVRNNFLNKDLKFEGEICKWSDIVDVYLADSGQTGTRLLPKLNDSHIFPEKMNKMKVKTCTQVLSYSVAAALSFTDKFSSQKDGKAVSSTTKNTSNAVLFFDNLFDSANGSTSWTKRTRGKELRKAVTDGSAHHEFWPSAVEKLKTMVYVDQKRGEVSVPSIKNWMITLRSYMRLWQFFRSKNIKIMRPRNFNSDPIENFFVQVRAYNFRNNDPSCDNFIKTFKSLLVTRLIKFHSAGFNCEDVSGEQLLNLKKIFEINDNQTPEISPSTHIPSNEISPEYIREQVRQERLAVHSRAYTAGWVVRKLLQKNNCNNCINELTTTEGSIHSWISEKEYNAVKRKSLTYPSEYAVRIFGIIVKETNKYLDKKPHINFIAKSIREYILSKYIFVFDCETHQNVLLDNILRTTIKFTIYNWCITINKILKGKDLKRLGSNLPLMKQKALDKYKKKLRNKKK